MKQIIINVPDNATSQDILVAVKAHLDPKTNGWVVVRDADKGEELGIGFLAMVDRSKTKDSWWTSDDQSIMMVFNNRGAAIKSANRLRFGNARVVSHDYAKNIIEEQANSISENGIENDCGDYMYHGDS